MSEPEAKQPEKVKIDPLELNKETVQDLKEGVAGEVKGGMARPEPISRAATVPCVAG